MGYGQEEVEGMIRVDMTYFCLYTILSIMDHSHCVEYIKRLDRWDSHDSSYCWRPSHLLGCNISNKRMRIKCVILPDNLYTEEIRGLVRFGREFRSIKKVILQVGGLWKQILTFGWKRGGRRIGHRVKSNCDANLPIFAQFHQELCSIYGPLDLGPAGPKWMGISIPPQSVIGYGVSLEENYFKQVILSRWVTT